MLKKYGLILFLGSFATYAVTKFASFLVSNGLSWIRIGTADGWIQFFGTIIGALVTILTVVDALKREREKEEEDIARKIMPYVHLSPIFKLNKREFEVAINDGITLGFPLVLHNFSENVAKEVTVINGVFEIFDSDINDYVIYNDEQHSELLNLYLVTFESTKTLTPKESYEFHATFIMNPDIYNNIYPGSFKKTFTVQYRDILNLKEYSIKFTYEFNVNFTNRNTFVFWFSNEFSDLNIS